MKKIIVTGCNGQLGRAINKFYANRTDLELVNTDVDELDITNIDQVIDHVNGIKPYAIINCAAYTAVDACETNQDIAFKVNTIGPRNLAIAAQKAEAKIIHISTDYVFDGTGDSPRTEDMEIAPIGVYGITKADGEKSVSENAEKYYILRTAWLYGWAGKNFVYTMLRAMNKNPAVKVVADQKGTPTFAGDLADVILKIISKENPIPYGIYHVTDLGETTWWDFTKEIKKQGIDAGYLQNKDCVVNSCTTEEYPTPAKRPAYSVLSQDKIQQALGITLPQWQESLSVFLKSDMIDKGRLE